MRIPFLAKWFLVGFAARALFAIWVFVKMRHDSQAGTLHYMDVPTLFVTHVLERAFPFAAHIGTGSPLFLRWNLIGCVVWGLIFMSGGWLFTLVATPIRRLR
ncbi:MAG TPA: hypothetical protein VFS77_18315 [Pyrinomonadaceae bacterium]|nr:hypothetical protein [Pyrinomonadaceae bacterium]